MFTVSVVVLVPGGLGQVVLMPGGSIHGCSTRRATLVFVFDTVMGGIDAGVVNIWVQCWEGYISCLRTI